jgi:hypothetical protein
MALDEGHRHGDAWTTFGVGVLGGVIGGLSVISFAGIFAVALIALVGGFAVKPRPFGAAGVLLGWAACWTILFAGAQARCDPGSCVGPDLTPWVGMIVSIALVGVSLLAVGLVRPAWWGRLAGTIEDLGRLRRVRIASALLLGSVAGVFAAPMFLPSLTTTILIGLWFALRHRFADRRAEIAWFGLALLVVFVALVPR